MTNFAGNLHLLVDSIHILLFFLPLHIVEQAFCIFIFFHYIIYLHFYIIILLSSITMTNDLARTTAGYGLGDTHGTQQFIVVVLLLVRQIIVTSSATA